MKKVQPEPTSVNHLAILHNQEEPVEPAKEHQWEDMR